MKVPSTGGVITGRDAQPFMTIVVDDEVYT